MPRCWPVTLSHVSLAAKKMKTLREVNSSFSQTTTAATRSLTFITPLCGDEDESLYLNDFELAQNKAPPVHSGLDFFFFFLNKSFSSIFYFIPVFLFSIKNKLNQRNVRAQRRLVSYKTEQRRGVTVGRHVCTSTCTYTFRGC